MATLPVINITNNLPAATYTYVCTDLVTNKLLGEIPLTGVSLDHQMNVTGNMTATANLSDFRIDDTVFINCTNPGKTALWAYRNDQIVWGGIIWTRQYHSQTRQLSLTGQTFESYASRRFPRSWLGTSVVNYNQGQSSIVVDIWEKMQQVAHGDIGVEPPTSLPSPDPTLALTVNGWDLTQSADNVIQQVVQQLNGPDYYVGWYTDSRGLPKKRLFLGAPLTSITKQGVDHPGTVLDYTLTEDATQGANFWWVQGSNPANATNTTNATAPVGTASNTNVLALGWPLLENVDGNFSTVTSQSLLNSYAQKNIQLFDTPALVHTADLAGQQHPQFGTYRMGDYFVFNILDPRFPKGVQYAIRVIGWTISPPDSAGMAGGTGTAGGLGTSGAGSGLEVISLIFDDAGQSLVGTGAGINNFGSFGG